MEVLTFGLNNEFEGVVNFIANLKLISNLDNIGDAKILIVHPASTTHEQLNDEEKKAVNITQDLLIISVGIENFIHIKRDFIQAFEKI